MASMFTSSALFLLVAALPSSASAGTFSITNNCGNTVWPAGIPVGGGTQLNPGQTWTVDVPSGTSGRFWGPTGCTFNSAGRGHCTTGDCAAELSCKLSGDTLTTLAEYTIDGGYRHDYYDIEGISGYNLAMAFSCSTGVDIVCAYNKCPGAYLFPADNKTHACNGNSNFQVTFCP